MVNLENLMFKPESFPSIAMPYKTTRGTTAYDFGRVEYPPYHPSMEKDGIDFKLAYFVIQSALELTIKDLEANVDKIPSLKFHLEPYIRDDGVIITKGIERDKKTNEIILGEVKLNGYELAIYPFPITDYLQIRKKQVQLSGSAQLSIAPDIAAPSFVIPKDVTLPEELIKEYELEEPEPYFLDQQRVKTPHCWYRHNVPDIDGIFFKNFIIQYDNALVKRKYSK